MAPPPATGQPAGILQKWWGHRVPLAISFGISLIFLLLYYSVLLSERTSAAANVLRRFELSTVDTRFLLREKLAKPSPDPRIVIVEIDQKAQETLGRWPFSRKYFADMLDVLREDGARTVGFDVTFSKPDDSAKPLRDVRERLEAQQKAGETVDPRVIAELTHIEGQYNVDQQFAESIRRFGRVVLGNFFFMSPQEAQTLDKAPSRPTPRSSVIFPFPRRAAPNPPRASRATFA